VGNAWFVFPLTDEWVEPLRAEGAAVLPAAPSSVAPTPNQVLQVVQSFPEYQVRVRRRDRKEKGQAVYIELRRGDGTYAVDIHLLGVRSDEQPVGTFVFEYYRETEELVRLVSPLAERCGPLVLYHDSGCEKSVIVAPGEKAEPSVAPDCGGIK
jgi:hypothetical protein